MLIIATLVLVSIVGVVALAKYVYQRNKIGTVKAKAFYFTSNLLEDASQDTITTYKLAPGTETIAFTLGNHADELRYSDVDINYKIYINDEELENVDYTTLSRQNKNDATIEIDTTDFVAGNTYTIKAVGYSGEYGAISYHKTLSADFVIQSDETGIYKWLDTSNSEYVLLTVWSQGQAGNVTITFPSENVIPDNTDNIMRNVSTVDGNFTDKVSFSGNQNYSSHVYRFFGKNISELSVDNFTVTYNNENKDIEAVEKQPQ